MNIANNNKEEIYIMAENLQGFPGEGTKENPFIVESLSDIFTPEVGVYYFETICNGEFLYNTRHSFELLVDFTAVPAKIVEEDGVKKLYRADVPEGEEAISVNGEDKKQIIFQDDWKTIHIDHTAVDVLADAEGSLVLTEFKQVIQILEPEE